MKYLKISNQNQFPSKGFSVVCLMIFLINIMTAQGDLLLFPKRVVFENKEKIEIINLTNIGEDTATFNISFVQYRMTEKGEFHLINEPDSGQLFASPFIRYYPRSVTLGPRESQVVKLQLINANSLMPFEYRSHLYFRSEIRNKKEEASKPDQDSSITIELIPQIGITIPCIIHPVEPASGITLSKLELLQDKDLSHQVGMEFHRSGYFSSYGIITAHYISLNGISTKIGEVKGFAVYAPGKLRKCIMNISTPNGVDFKTGNIEVVYSFLSQGGKEMASSNLNLSN